MQPTPTGPMRIVADFPPLYDEIAAAFDLRGIQAIFCWGGRIYNPSGILITPALMAHEAVHGARQGLDITGWWRRYIEDPAFRLAEEIPAHREEYRVTVEHARNRNERRAAEKGIARRLASPLYGRMITLPAARRLVRQEGHRHG